MVGKIGSTPRNTIITYTRKQDIVNSGVTQTRGVAAKRSRRKIRRSLFSARTRVVTSKTLGKTRAIRPASLRSLLAERRDNTRPGGGRGGSQERGKRLAQPGLCAEDRECSVRPQPDLELSLTGRFDLELSLHQGIVHSIRPDHPAAASGVVASPPLCLEHRPVDAL